MFRVDIEKSLVSVKLIDRWEHSDPIRFCSEVVHRVSSVRAKNVVVEFGANFVWDSTLLVVIEKLNDSLGKSGVKLSFKNVPENFVELLKLVLREKFMPDVQRQRTYGLLWRIGDRAEAVFAGISNFMHFLRSVGYSIALWFRGKSSMRYMDFLFMMEDCGPKAVGIVSLISFMIGLILAFVGAMELKLFGAEIYIASLVMVGMIRIMGAIMTGVIMAGRTASSYAASIGTMQVNEELDAMKTMGISRVDFLFMPRLLSLVIAMPILTMISDFMGVVGGFFVGVGLMGINSAEYLRYTFDAFSLDNFLVGVFHGVVYAFIIVLCGCYCGFRCGRDAESVGRATTQAVVKSIVYMIVATGIITVVFERLGI